MPRMPKLAAVETLANGRPSWVVSVPPIMTASGKRERRFFSDPREAEKLAAKLRGQFSRGRVGTVGDPMLAKEAIMAMDLLAPHGFSLIEAVRAYVKILEEKTDTRTFCDAAADYVMRNEMHWSERYAREMANLDKWLPVSFALRRVCDITADTIRIAVEERTTSKEMIKRKTTQIESVLSGKGKERRAEQIPLITVDQIRRMFRAARRGEERRLLAVLFYTGIRPDARSGEIGKLDWSDFKGDTVILPASVSKVNKERKIDFTPRLARMIKGHPKSGTLIPSGWAKRWPEIRKAAGLRGKDETRHSFASHALLAFGEGWTVNAMGHSKSTTTHQHYLRTVTIAEARSYFGLKGK